MRRNPITLLLRRLSKSRTTKPNAITIAPNRRTSPSGSSTTPVLFLLPTELLIQILIPLPFSSLCALRQTCHHAAFTILTSPDILSSWLNHNISPIQQRLYSPPSPGVTFHFLLEQHRRWHSASTLTTALCSWVKSSILADAAPNRRSTARNPDERWDPQWGKVIPLLLILQHYLESLSNLWLTLPTTPIPPPRSFTEVFRKREDDIFTRNYTLDEIEDVNKLWQFMWCTMRLLLRRPGGVVTEEQLRTEPAPTGVDDLNIYVLFGNTRGILTLVKSERYQERRRAIDALLESLNPGRNVYKWRESWRALSFRFEDPGPEKVQIGGALTMERGRYDIWARTARQILVDKGRIGNWREIIAPMGTARQMGEFLRDVTGYESVRDHRLSRLMTRNANWMFDEEYFAGID